MDERSTTVMILGAGPTGLMLAVCLRRLGVPCLIADRKHGPTRESRALALQARSLEIYDQLGLSDKVLAGAAAAPAIVPGFRDRPFTRFSFTGLGADLTPYPGVYVFEQSRNERLLLQALEDDGGSVLWGHHLEEVERGAGGGVGVLLRDDDGRETRVAARYLVGADGASSAVRELSGIPFDGVTNPHTFYVADARGVTGLVEGCVNLRFSATDFLLTFPQGAPGHHRLIGVVRTDRGEEVSETSAHGTLAREFGVRFEDTAWFSTYRVHHRVARRFRDGPVFLAGDAAHVHSPVGAQGMNTGLQDAHNLACALAEVVRGGAGEERLDRYQEERRPVAVRLVRTTDRLFGAVTTDTALSRFLRSEVLPRLAPLAGRFLPRLARGAGLFEYVSQIRIHYWMDPGARRRARGHRGTVVGRRLPWNGDNFAALRALEWQVHVYGDADDDALERMGRESRMPVRHFAVVKNERLRAGAGDTAGLAVLVRPDGFVAGARPLPASVSDWAVHATRTDDGGRDHGHPLSSLWRL